MTQPQDDRSVVREMMADIAPRLADITKEVVVDQLWGHDDLTPRDRSFITVAALTALYRTDQLKAHIGRALDNGVTREEIGAIITHMAAYAGWPTAVNAVTVAREVYVERNG
jgi:4-carboxymuconolactone decarboxylase